MGAILILLVLLEIGREFKQCEKRMKEGEQRAKEREFALQKRIETLEATVFPSQSDLLCAWLETIDPTLKDRVPMDKEE